MFIIADENAKGLRFPWVTVSLVVINLLVFLAQLALGEKLNYGFSLVPAEIVTGKDLTKPQDLKVKVPVRDYFEARRYKSWTKDAYVKVPQHTGPFPIHLTLLTSMFMHTGWIHLIGNMWFLLIFGKNIEHAMKPGLFLGFYVICGIAAGLAHVIVDPKSIVPCMGASGAISGVLGAYVCIYPLNKVKVWLGWWFGCIDLPAFAALGVWFAVQYLSGVASIMDSDNVHGGVAYWAHIGGFLAGVAFVIGLIVYLRHQQNSAPPEEAVTDETGEPVAATKSQDEIDRLFAGTAPASEKV